MITGSTVRFAKNGIFINSQANRIYFQRKIRYFATSDYPNIISKRTSANEAFSSQEDETVRRAFRLHSESDRCVF